MLKFRPVVRRALFLSAASICLAAALALVLLAVTRKGFWDFDVFYSSARLALEGRSFYTTFGEERLPYWYFPWLAWFFLPLALLPLTIAKIVYVIATLFSLVFVVRVLGRFFDPEQSPAMLMFVVSMSLFMTMLLFIAGQMDYLLLVAITAVMLVLDRGRPVYAGALFPILLFKPHLLAVFLPWLLIRGGRTFAIVSAASTGLLAMLAFVIVPGWPAEMVRMLSMYGERADNFWNFITFPQLLGSQENWSGTANIPMTLALFVLGMAVAWRFRRLPLVPFLALTLAASMLCAPRAYTYNLPILIPPMLWISARQRTWGPLLWFGGGLLSVASGWSTGAYLIVILVFGLCIFRGLALERATKGAEVRSA